MEFHFIQFRKNPKRSSVEMVAKTWVQIFVISYMRVEKVTWEHVMKTQILGTCYLRGIK